MYVCECDSAFNTVFTHFYMAMHACILYERMVVCLEFNLIPSIYTLYSLYLYAVHNTHIPSKIKNKNFENLTNSRTVRSIL